MLQLGIGQHTSLIPTSLDKNNTNDNSVVHVESDDTEVFEKVNPVEMANDNDDSLIAQETHISSNNNNEKPDNDRDEHYVASQRIESYSRKILAGLSKKIRGYFLGMIFFCWLNQSTNKKVPRDRFSWLPRKP